MRYIYQVVITKDEGSYSMEVPDLPGCFTWGASLDAVIAKAPDALETHVGALISYGEDIPAATFGHVAQDGEVVVVVSFDATAASVGAPHVTAATAAERLGVTPARVSHLLRDGLLEGYRSGREVMVSVASIDARLAIPRKAGRPRKEFSTA
ncbi:MAG: type II toxin-antitoxin system HicB family antitoxin [Coriobacteriales bacterium]|jgi:predicted RNase H-like HicB family nuclease|nr:type II toxin-antitoxin system HicB family antitoxin [Coriobacteriales bacterium]